MQSLIKNQQFITTDCQKFLNHAFLPQETTFLSWYLRNFMPEKSLVREWNAAHMCNCSDSNKSCLSLLRLWLRRLMTTTQTNPKSDDAALVRDTSQCVFCVGQASGSGPLSLCSGKQMALITGNKRSLFLLRFRNGAKWLRASSLPSDSLTAVN